MRLQEDQYTNLGANG